MIVGVQEELDGLLPIAHRMGHPDDEVAEAVLQDVLFEKLEIARVGLDRDDTAEGAGQAEIDGMRADIGADLEQGPPCQVDAQSGQLAHQPADMIAVEMILHEDAAPEIVLR